MNMNALKIQLNTSTATIHSIARTLQFEAAGKKTPDEMAKRDEILRWISEAKKQLPATPVGIAHRNTLTKIAKILEEMEG